jgi:hypothetical protein
MLQETEEYRRFVQRRAFLNTRLAETGADVDAWIQTHEGVQPALSQLGLLEGLLSERRNLLRELADLDDDFVTYMLRRDDQRRDPS